MDPRSVLESLRNLCDDLDSGRPLRRIDLRKLVVPIAVPAAMGLAAISYVGCTETTPVYGVPIEDNCSDGIDNDDDGDTDCADLDCEDAEPCVGVPPYSVPFEDKCNDDIENDIDGLIE